MRGRLNGSEPWDIGFYNLDNLASEQTWTLDDGNGKALIPGDYSFRISYSIDGENWTEVGQPVNFTIDETSSPVTPEPPVTPDPGVDLSIGEVVPIQVVEGVDLVRDKATAVKVGMCLTTLSPGATC